MSEPLTQLHWWDRLNATIPLVRVRTGTTVRMLTDWVPVQVRRFARLAVMTAVAMWAQGTLGGGAVDLEATVWTSLAMAVQEVLHRALAPATPDNESSQFSYRLTERRSAR